MSVPQNLQELEGMLRKLLEPDTAVVAFATKILKKFLKNPSCVVPLLSMLSDSPHDEIRQLSCVLLRNKINVHWMRLPSETRDHSKKLLLQRLASEPSRRTRISVAALISSLSLVTVASGDWEELLSFLLAMSQAERPEHRETAMMLFRALAENIGRPLKKHFKTLLAIFQRALSDPHSPHVRIEGLRALEALLELLEEEDEDLILSFKNCVPDLLGLLKHCLSRFREDDEAADALAVGFEVFDSLVMSELPVVTAHVPIFVPFMLEVAVNRQIPHGMRDNAVQLLISLAASKPAQLVKLNLVEPCVTAVFMINAEVHPESADWADPDPHLMGAELLEALIAHLPRKHVFAFTLEKALIAARSENAMERKAALHVIATLSEGYPADAIDNLPHLLEVVFLLCRDQEHLVRSAALYALSSFADYLQPDIVQHKQASVSPSFHLLLFLCH